MPPNQNEALLALSASKSTEGKRHGSFHTWGTCAFEDKQITVAIVEGADGKIFCVQPDYIEFIENTTFITGQRTK
jgi:hypothetical protein